MIFRFLLLFLFVTILSADDYKYKLELNEECVTHSLEKKESASSSNLLYFAICDDYDNEEYEDIFVVSQTVGAGRTYYLDSFDSSSTFFYGFRGGIGEGEYQPNDAAEIESYLLEAALNTGYERYISQGFLLSIGVTYTYRHLFLDSEKEKRLEEYEEESSDLDLELYILAGIRF